MNDYTNSSDFIEIHSIEIDNCSMKSDLVNLSRDPIFSDVYSSPIYRSIEFYALLLYTQCTLYTLYPDGVISSGRWDSSQAGLGPTFSVKGVTC